MRLTYHLIAHIKKCKSFLLCVKIWTLKADMFLHYKKKKKNYSSIAAIQKLLNKWIIVKLKWKLFEIVGICEFV